ncbi:MAG: hypothetical protein RLZZ580_1559, partial [Cyanobacteriota bacterium]
GGSGEALRPPTGGLGGRTPQESGLETNNLESTVFQQKLSENPNLLDFKL